MALGDAVIVLVALSSSYVARRIVEGDPLEGIVGRLLTPWTAAVIVIHLLSLFVFNLYDLNARFRRVRWLLWITFAVSASALVSALMLFLVAARPVIGRVVLFLHVPFAIAGTYAWRWFFFKRLLRTSRRRRLVLVGFDRSFQEFVAGLDRFPVKEYEFIGVVAENGSTPAGWPGPGAFVCLDGRPLAGVLEQLGADVVVCSLNSGLSERLLRQVLDLRQGGIEVYDLPGFYSHLLGRIPVFSVNAPWVLQRVGRIQSSLVSANLTRLVEIVGAAVLLAATAPIMLVIAAAIKLDSRGPALFLQERLGLYQVPFRVYKFRTMVQDAEARTGPVWAGAGDPRVTRVGRFLRGTRLDELPQLINILRGEMGFVGFRPIRKHFADLLQKQIPFYSLRFSIRPGLTGWPQVQHDYSGSVEGQIKKFEYELYYLANASPFLDAFILLKTVQVVLFGRGQ
jgi:exopolysaccharide biosynthesis polyprenyl glycosylphosphotransferase